MNYDGFIRDFFSYLKSNDKKCLKLIEKNKKFVEETFNKNSNPEILKEFVNEFNYSILQNSKGNYKLFEKILKTESFGYVYSLIKNSNVLIEACKHIHVEAANWLITMDINPYIKEKKTGRSALMYAVQDKKFQSVVEKYGKDFKCVMMEDEDGNNALYYAIENISLLSKLEEVDINHVNHKHETILMYCYKKKAFEAFKTLLDRQGMDVNIPDEEGKTIPMKLIEDQKFTELGILRKKECNFNSYDVLSTYIKEMYQKKQSADDYTRLALIIICLIKAEVDFNVVVDEDGNTALMAILIAHDYETFGFICSYSKNLDFKKKNKYGENVTSLFLKLDVQLNSFQKDPLLGQPTFDFKYVDLTTNNTALILAVINKPKYINKLLKFNYSSINEVNIHQENALLIATKMNKYSTFKLLLEKCANVHQQDDTGNTALHYAVRAKNIPMIYDLLQSDANPQLKNNEKESAFELAQKLGDKKVMDTFLGTLPLIDYVQAKVAEQKSEGVRTPQIDEYLYTNTTNVYSNYDREVCQKTLTTHYQKYLESIIENKEAMAKRGVSLLSLMDDVLFYSWLLNRYI